MLDVLEPDSLLCAGWATAPVVEYLQLVEGRRPDVATLNRFLISEASLNELLADQILRRPLYLDTPTLSSAKLETTPIGPLHRVRQRASAGNGFDSPSALESGERELGLEE